MIFSILFHTQLTIGVEWFNSYNKSATAQMDGGTFVGAANRIRTDDLVITNDVLYRLSYSSIALGNGDIITGSPSLVKGFLKKYFTFL